MTPARNCTYGCSYCYVPTMGIYGGLKPEDWKRWGQFTTFKANAALLLRKQSRPDQIIYCSPLVDPYQPAEAVDPHLPALLAAVAETPPCVFAIQTRSPLILRDLAILRKVALGTKLRISFSITTNRDDVRRRYEPHCEPNDQRLAAVRELRAAGIEVYATLAPLLPCDPERLAEEALEATGRRLIGDPLHVRGVKPRGATTRHAAFQIAERYGEAEWFAPAFQESVVHTMKRVARAANLDFATGPEGFQWLAQP
ncbi:MAG: radical SAM protein [Bryobacteraceae bacterium]